MSIAGATSNRVAFARSQGSPIQHVVIIYQENHSFDNVLGSFCLSFHPSRCDGASVGTLPSGQQIQLASASDKVPSVDHTSSSQATAIDGGKMDGFGKIQGCTADLGYRCYSQFAPKQIPNLTALAQNFAVSDRTFEMNAIPSWGAHVELAASTLDGFVGDNPFRTSGPKGPG
jgi:phospholipase C